MFCEKCGKPMADGDKFCMECGWKVPEEPVVAPEAEAVKPAEEPAAPAEEKPAAEAVLSEEKEVAAEPAQAEEKAEAPAAAQEKAVEEKVSDKDAKKAAKEAAKEAKKSAKQDKPAGKGKKVALGIVCVVVVAAIVVLFGSSIANFFRANIGSPVKYYKYVEKKEAAELIDMMSAYYELTSDNVDWNSKSTNFEMSVSLGEDIRDLIGFTGVDMDWLENVAISFGTNVKNPALGANVALNVNKESLLSGNAAVDLEGEEAYLQIPELNKTYLGVEFDADDIGYDEDMWDVMKDASKQLPDGNRLEKIAEKYVKIALDQIEDVDRDKKNLKAEGVSKKYTRLRVTIDEDALQDIMEAVFKEMEDDKELEDLILDMAAISEEYADVDPDDVYDAFLEFVDMMQDEAKYIGDSDTEIEMTLWVDGKGEVKGREIKVDETVITYAMPQKGAEFGFEFSYEDYWQSMGLVGKGKRAGDKISGTFEVEYESGSVVEVVVDGFDTEAFKEGYLNGKFTFGLTKAAEAAMGFSGMASGMVYEEDAFGYSSGPSMLSALMDYKIRMDVSTAKDKGDCKIELLDGKEVLASASVSASLGSGTKVTMPSSKNVAMVEELDDLTDWAEDIDFDKFLSKLEDKVGVPSDWIESIEMMLDWYL